MAMSPASIVGSLFVAIAAAGAAVFGNEAIPPADVSLACDSFGVAQDAAELVIVLNCHANGNDVQVHIPGISVDAVGTQAE